MYCCCFSCCSIQSEVTLQQEVIWKFHLHQFLPLLCDDEGGGRAGKVHFLHIHLKGIHILTMLLLEQHRRRFGDKITGHYYLNFFESKKTKNSFPMETKTLQYILMTAKTQKPLEICQNQRYALWPEVSNPSGSEVSTLFCWTKDTPKPKFFEKRKKSSKTQNLKNV